MSGGHFDYKQHFLGYIADDIERDLDYNHISYDEAEGEGPYKNHGYGLQPETVEFLREVVSQLRKLEYIVHQYDLVVSGDTCEENFIKRCMK